MMAVNREMFEAMARSVRRRIIKAIFYGGKGHLGGALSCADVILYLYVTSLVNPCGVGLRVNTPFIMSKGHSATALLAVLDELGIVNGLLESYNRDGSLVGNNPSELVPGVEFHTGSLGHGVGLGCGVALAKELAGEASAVVILISDGELLEGSTWEGLLFAVAKKLNVCVIVDRNNQICENFMSESVDVQNLSKVLTGIGLDVHEVNGHDFEQLATLNAFVSQRNAPRVVIANTIKGKGVSFMEGVIRWHHSIPSAAEFDAAMRELT